MKPRDQQKFPLNDLPPELILGLLRYLSLKDLAATVFVSKAISSLAITEYEQKEIRKYQQNLADTELWWNLIFLVQADKTKVGDRLFIKYLETIIGNIPFEDRINLRTFSKFMQNAMSVPWIRELPASFLETIASAQEVAGQLLKGVLEGNTEEVSADQPKTLIEFMKANKGNFTNLYLWESYSNLHRMILAFALVYQLSRANNDLEKISIITKPVYSYLIDEEMLLFLDKAYLSKLILSMLEEAVRLYRIPSRQPAQEQNLQEIENTLAKLSEDDLSVYFTRCFENDTFGNLKNRFGRIFESSYPFLTQKLTEKVILAITKIYDDVFYYFRLDNAPRIAAILISSEEVLDRLSQKGFVTLLKRLPIRDIQQVLSNPVVAPRLTFPIIKQWLDSSKDLSFITYEEEESHFNARATEILINANLLTRLTRDEVVFIAGFIISSGAKEVVNNANFINRVLQEQHPASFLMALCNIKLGFFLDVIIRHEQLIGLFSNEEKMLLAFNHIEALEFFLENKEEAKKFSDQQLWELVEKGGGIVLSIVIKNNLYDRFSNSCLKKFAEKWLSKGELTAAEEHTLSHAHFTRNRPDLFLAKFSVSELAMDQPSQLEADIKAPKDPEAINSPECQESKFPQVFSENVPIKPGSRSTSAPVISRPAQREVSVDAQIEPEKLLEKKPFNALTRKNPYLPKVRSAQKKQPNHTKYIIPIILYSLLMLAGLTLIAMGIGFSFGVPLCIKASTLLFGWAKVNLLISPILAGTAIEAAAVVPAVQKIMEYKEELSIQKISYYSTASNPLSLKPFPSPVAHLRQSPSAISYTEQDNQFDRVSSLRTRHGFHQAKSSRPIKSGKTDSVQFRY